MRRNLEGRVGRMSLGMMAEWREYARNPSKHICESRVLSLSIAEIMEKEILLNCNCKPNKPHLTKRLWGFYANWKDFNIFHKNFYIL